MYDGLLFATNTVRESVETEKKMLTSICRRARLNGFFLERFQNGRVACSRNYGEAKPGEAESTPRRSFNLYLESLETAIESCDFANGMRLICERRNSYMCTIGCYLPAGAIHETPAERGSSLFLEHLLFKRTASRTKGQIEDVVEELGGCLRARASREKFLFYGTVPYCNVKPFVQLLADIIQNSFTCEEDVAAEKSAILTELDELETDKERVVMDYLQDVAYRGTPLEKSVYPESKVIKEFCADNLIAFRRRVFKACLMTMVCVGPISLHELQELLSECFTADECEPSLSFYKAKPKTERHEYRFSGSELRFRDDDEELAHVAVGIEGCSSEERQDYFVLTVAKQIVGSWDKSCSGANHNAPLIAHCAFNTDLCQEYKSFFLSWPETSIWGCYFVCGRMSQADMLWLVQKTWMKLCTTVTEKEVARAVNQCRMHEFAKLQHPCDRFLDIVENLSKYGYYETVQKRIARYERVTADKIREAAAKYIYDQSPAVAAFGCVENLPDYLSIRSGMYLLRY